MNKKSRNWNFLFLRRTKIVKQISLLIATIFLSSSIPRLSYKQTIDFYIYFPDKVKILYTKTSLLDRRAKNRGSSRPLRERKEEGAWISVKRDLLLKPPLEIRKLLGSNHLLAAYSVLHIKRRRWIRCREAEQNGGRGATAGHVTNNHTNVQANVPNVYNLGSSAFNRDVLPLFHVPGGELDPPVFSSSLFSFLFFIFFFLKRISSSPTRIGRQ